MLVLFHCITANLWNCVIHVAKCFELPVTKCAVTELTIFFPNYWFEKDVCSGENSMKYLVQNTKKVRIGSWKNQYPSHFRCCSCVDYDLETAFSIGIYLPNYFYVDNILFLFAFFALLIKSMHLPVLFIKFSVNFTNYGTWVFSGKELKDHYKQHAAFMSFIRSLKDSIAGS